MDLLLISMLVFATALSLLLLALRRAPEAEAVGARLAAIEQERSSRAETLSLPFHRRVFLPMLHGFASIARRLTPPGSIDVVRANLEMAGRRQTDPLVWIARKWAVVVGLMVVTLVVLDRSELALINRVAMAVAMGGFAYLWPELMLRSAILARQARIIKELPETLDLLTISVEAGLGLDQALETVTSRRGGPLADEIRTYLDEVGLGRDRQEALKAIGSRTGVTDLISLAATLTQAMEYGISIATVLRIQSDEVRIRRRQRIEERAMKAPVKLLFPLIFLIMPALFVVVAAPGLIRAYAQFVGPRGPGEQFAPPPAPGP
jgi:tight adherence protein C